MFVFIIETHKMYNWKLCKIILTFIVETHTNYNWKLCKLILTYIVESNESYDWKLLKIYTNNNSNSMIWKVETESKS